jgi:tRNA (guanine-N7-)-methyltransferase
MTAGQARALETLAARYCVYEATFLAQLPLPGRCGLEIGFGMGQALVDWCCAEPDTEIVGIEVYQPGIGSAMLRAEQAAVTNLTILEGDAARILAESTTMPWLDELRIFFPDPWPKKRHAKRRIIQPDFVAVAASRMRPGALLRVATDWQPYAEWINEVLPQEPLLENLGGVDGFAPRFAERGETNFEARGRRLGHAVWDFLYARRQPAGAS